MRQQGVGRSKQEVAKTVVLPKVWAVSSRRRRCEGGPQGRKPLSGGGGSDVRAEARTLQSRTLTLQSEDHGLHAEACSVSGEASHLQREIADRQVESANNKVEVRGELAFYRKYTEAMVRRYGAMSMEAGRVPSLMGREMFRGKVTSCRVRGFDDVVIFCHDVETCLKRLNVEDQQLIKRVTLQGYAVAEAAGMLGMSVGGCARLYARAVDRLTEKLLEAELMNPAICCQERKTSTEGPRD